VVLGALVAGALALSGCVSPPPSPFERERTAADELPAVISDDALDGVELSTVRYQGSTDSVEVWVAREKANRGICIIVAAPGDPSEWVVGCGGGSSFVAVGLGTTDEFEFYPWGLPGDEPREGWIAVSDYVIARE